MDVAIDCSCVAKPERTGVARYCLSLIRALPRAIGPDDRVTLLYRMSRWRRRRWFERVKDPRFSVRVFHDKVVPVGVGRVDVVHGPDLRIPRVRVPAVSTVHDLSALDVEGVADEQFRASKQRALLDVAERAAVILCISAFSEAAFLRRYPQAAGRTRVVPLGLADGFGPPPPERVDEVLARRGLTRPYLLFVGQIAPRKNLIPLLIAFERLRGRASGRDLSLVVAGPVKGGGDEIVAAMRASKHAEAVKLLGFLGDDELPALYAGAAAFVFPGKGEGFGLPILEAMSCGAPVVVADAGANPSTAGDAALLFDPDDADALAAAVERALTQRDDLVARGQARAARFTWDETARLTVAAYRDALSVGVPA